MRVGGAAGRPQGRLGRSFGGGRGAGRGRELGWRSADGGVWRGVRQVAAEGSVAPGLRLGRGSRRVGGEPGRSV